MLKQFKIKNSKFNIVSNLMLLTLLPLAADAEVQTDVCRPFYRALQSVPHLVLQESATTEDCLLTLVTETDLLGERALPDFRSFPGWAVAPESEADGPGSSAFDLVQKNARCRIYQSQPAEINAQGELVQSETITVMVECNQQMESVARGLEPENQVR